LGEGAGAGAGLPPASYQATAVMNSLVGGQSRSDWTRMWEHDPAVQARGRASGSRSLAGIDDHPVVFATSGGRLVYFNHERLAGIDGSVNITDRGGLVAADYDAAINDLWECLGQSGPDNQAAEKNRLRCPYL